MLAYTVSFFQYNDAIRYHLSCLWTVHGMEYAFGAHEFPTSGVFEVEPRSCPGFTFRQSIFLGTTDMSISEFRCFIEALASKYRGDTYHLITKNCNHFTDEVCQQLTGKPIPAWVNRLARVGEDLSAQYLSFSIFGYSECYKASMHIYVIQCKGV